MSTTATAVASIPSLSHTEAMALAEAEYGRMADLLRGLAPGDWSKPTDCDRWTVKDIVAHIVGINEGVLSMREMIRQQRAGKPIAKREGLSKFDASNEVQVLERSHLSPAEVAAAYEKLVPRILRRRTRFPALLHPLPIPDGMGGWFKTGYLMDIVLTRDIWMHRVDITRATGREMILTPEHDGRLVADVVADWARRHGKAFTLHLEGPVGGGYKQGSGGEEYRLDAVEFCRSASGRGTGAGLLSTVVPF